jgi:hypothetical protein
MDPLQESGLLRNSKKKFMRGKWAFYLQWLPQRVYRKRKGRFGVWTQRGSVLKVVYWVLWDWM